MTSVEELQQMLNNGAELSIKVVIMHDKLKSRHFEPLTSYHSKEYFDRPNGYYFDEHPEDNDYGAIICLRSGLIICIELQGGITKVIYSSRTNSPFSEKMLEQRGKIEVLLKDYIEIV
jgi:hypothetical protein